MKKVVLGLSGGVDSAVSARLLQNAGYEVHGLFLDIGNPVSRADAEAAAASLGVELTVADVAAELEREVCAPFAASYLRGETPNPCILCNPAVKFRHLCDRADALGAEAIATGHYARVKDGKLLRATSSKDQSYMLYRLPPEVIARCVFPLGETEDKAEVRELARRAGLSGNFIDESGRVLGPDGGIHRYTIGQRRGLGIASTGRLYVSEIRVGSGDVVLSLNDPVVTRCHMKDMAFPDPEYMDKESFDCLVRVRHSRGFAAGRCFPGRGYIDFEQPVRAVTPGQSAVCYTPDDRQVVCGGFITEGVE